MVDVRFLGGQAFGRIVKCLQVLLCMCFASWVGRRNLRGGGFWFVIFWSRILYTGNFYFQGLSMTEDDVHDTLVVTGCFLSDVQEFY